jgi:hypothetical protein
MFELIMTVPASQNSNLDSDVVLVLSEGTEAECNELLSERLMDGVSAYWIAGAYVSVSVREKVSA